MKVGFGERHSPESFGIQTTQTNDPSSIAVLTNRLDPHRFTKQRAADDLPFSKGKVRLSLVRTRF
jgi:hypothetical protein